MKRKKLNLIIFLIVSVLVSSMYMSKSAAKNVYAETIDPAIELQIRQDYLEQSAGRWDFDLTLDDIQIDSYYGNINGLEVIQLDRFGGLLVPDAGVMVRIGGYTLSFGNGWLYNYMFCWEPGSFLRLKEAYQEGVLSQEDIYCIGRRAGLIPWREDIAYEDVDMKNDWFAECVSDLYERSVMTGLNFKSFAPYEPLLRAQFVTILGRIEAAKPMGEYKTSFPDVTSSDWYGCYVSWAAKNKIVSGYANGMFGPTDTITREQLAVMLYRFAEYRGYDVTKRADLDTYPDVKEVSSFARDAVSWCVAEGIISGDNGYLKPLAETTRAEGASMVSRYMYICE